MLSIQKILCAVDFSEHSKEVAQHAKLLATSLGSDIVCVYVAPSLSQYVGFKVPVSSIEGVVDDIVSGAEETMKEFVAEHFSGVSATGKILVGYAAEEVLDCALAEKAGMIVMGTHGRKGIDRMLFGSVAEKIVKSAKCPVVTIRPL